MRSQLFVTYAINSHARREEAFQIKQTNRQRPLLACPETFPRMRRGWPELWPVSGKSGRDCCRT
jgi:hypothetical protein